GGGGGADRGRPPPRRERREREREEHLRVEAEREKAVEGGDEEEMRRPRRAEKARLALDVSEVGRGEEGPEEEDVVERGMRRGGLLPRERCRPAPRPAQADERDEADRAADRDRPEPL